MPGPRPAEHLRPPADSALASGERLAPLGATLLLAIHAALLTWSVFRQAPTVDEPFHLVAGLEHWQLGEFNVDRGNPPLVGSVAALPVLLARPRIDWSRAPNSYALGSDFARINGPRTFWLIALGRLACIPFSVLGAWVCFHWGRALYGSLAGLLAMALWCASPNILGNGPLITGDTAATAVGIAAFYGFWRWLRQPSLGRAVAAGVLLGLAELAKFVWLVAYPLWFALWLACRRPSSTTPRRSLLREAAHMALIVFLCLDVINLGYAFEGPWQSLDSYHSGRKLLAQLGPTSIAAKMLAKLPVPLPANYLRGMDEIVHLGQRQPWTYLGGVRRDGGWWYFYPYASLLKLPLGTLVALQLAVALAFLPRFRARWGDELFLLLPVAGVFLFVQASGVSQVFRYVLPSLPFAFIAAGKAARSFANGDRSVARLTVVCLGATVASSVWSYPHSLAYFNELAGGPRRGHEHLINSDIDWGQDLLFLKRWLDGHPQARPLHLAYFGRIDPALAGIEYTLPPKARPASAGDAAPPTAEPALPPGWYAISVNLLRGFAWLVPDGEGRRQWIAGPEFQYFLSRTPAAMAGYSIYIYRVDTAELP